MSTRRTVLPLPMSLATGMGAASPALAAHRELSPRADILKQTCLDGLPETGHFGALSCYITRIIE